LAAPNEGIMAKKSTARRGYNAYLRAAKRIFGVTHKEARAMYRLARARAGESVSSRELTKHPIVSKRIANVVRGISERPRTGSRPGEPGNTAKTRSIRGKPVPEKAPAAPRRATTIRQWEEWYDFDDEYEDMTLEAGVDTGRKQ
jgi:hypothetical protein